MPDETILTAKLVALLTDIHFPERYYGYYEQGRHRSGMAKLDQAAIVKALEATGLSFRFSPREKFFYYRETHTDLEIGLHIAFSASSAEFILVLNVKGVPIGSPYPGLAHLVEATSNPDFAYTPAYPRLRFSNLQELQEVTVWSTSMFRTIRDAVLLCDWNKA